MSSGWVSRGHGAIAPFQLLRAASVLDALRSLRRGAVVMAGGVDVIQDLKDGAAPPLVISLNAVPKLRDIGETTHFLHLGAGVTHRMMETDDIVRRVAPELSDAWATIGNVRVRLAGTIGGNLMTPNPNYDAGVLLRAVDARVRFAWLETEKLVRPAEDNDWAVPREAILTEVLVPKHAERRLAFDRSLKPAISVAVSLEQNDGEWTARAAIGCARERPYCASLGTARDPKELAASANDIGQRFCEALTDVKDDVFGSAAYRRRMAAVLVARQLKALAGEDA